MYVVQGPDDESQNVFVGKKKFLLFFLWGENQNDLVRLWLSRPQ